MKRGLIIVSFLILLSLYLLNPSSTGFSTGFSTAIETAAVDEEVLDTLDKNDKASVIVVLKESKTVKQKGFIISLIKTKSSKQKVLSTLSGNEFKKKHEYSIITGFSGEVTEEGLEKLRQDPNVEKIYFDRPYKVSLVDSVPLINASKMHPYQIENQNVTGAGETICILDTGINYTHESFGSCSETEFLNGNCDKIPEGYDYINIDNNPYDDNGHGTHVAGIAAANGNIIGVAPDAKIVSIKVCDSGGTCTSSAIISGLEWCVTNKDNFNISVISMSLGDGGEYTSINCPTDYADGPSLAAAYAAGIFLTASSGNDGYTSGISYPSCNENVTSAGAVDKSDSITYNRGGDLLTILAPGVSIISTWHDGGTKTLPGTSMSAPHIAGAAAILQQYAKANFNLLNQSEIENALNNTGKAIYDSSSNGTYSRISVYEAVKSLTDNICPSLSLTAPSNSTYNTNNSLSLNYTTDDVNNIDTEWYNINDGTNNTLSGDTTFNTSEGSQILNLYANDSLGNENHISISFTTDLTSPAVTLLTQNNSYQKNPITLTFSLTEQNPGSCNLYGSWNGWHINQTKPASENNFTINLEDGDYKWNIECNDSANNLGSGDKNYTIKVDSTSPTVIIDLPQNTTYATNTSLELNFSATDSNLDSCWYNLNNGNITIDNCANTTFNTSKEPNNLKLFVNDSASNEASAEISFIADISYPLINLTSPSEDASIESPASLTYTVEDYGIANCSLSINGTINSTDDSITTSATQEFSVTLTNDNYYWSVSCTDSTNKENISEERAITICTENWNCTEWESCSDSQQARTCTDLNNCGTTHSKSTESQSCSSESDDSSSGDDSGAANSATISSDDEEVEEDESPPAIELPEAIPSQAEEQEEEIKIEEIAKEIIEEEKGFISKAFNTLKKFTGWITKPKQTATSISTRAVDGVKNHKIAVSSFVFVIAVMVFVQFYFLKKYNISLTKKVTEKMSIPRPNIAIPPKIKNLKAKFKDVHKNIKPPASIIQPIKKVTEKMSIPRPNIIIPPKIKNLKAKFKNKNAKPSEENKIQPVKKARESIFKKFNPFKKYKDILKPKKPSE
ncbi:MAG: S8 family serine peptidase [Nanoarchaeota archaeon]|nr:S8 family serine peptidase [Nanoarchaeota archaeon]